VVCPAIGRCPALAPPHGSPSRLKMGAPHTGAHPAAASSLASPRCPHASSRHPRLAPSPAPPPSGRARRGCRWPGEAGLIVPHAPPTARLGHVRPRRPPAPASASCLPPPSPTTLSRPRPWPAVSSRGPSLPCPLRREGPICGMFDGKN
jgi:hypothetical protein